MQSTSSLLRVSDIKPGVNFPFTRSWAYKQVHLKKLPGVFVKIGTSLCIDLDAFDKLAEKGRLK